MNSRILSLFAATAGAVHLSLSAAHAALDTEVTSQIAGLKGTWNADEGVYKIAAPRNDVPVTVDGWKMPPFMGLTSWAAFAAGKTSDAMIAGDLVLFEGEATP